VNTIEGVKISFYADLKVYGIPRELLVFLAEAFNTEVKNSGTTEWVTIKISAEKEVTFFGR
jgi:hypothetical protein